MGKSKHSIFDTVKAALRSRYLQCFINPAEVRLLEICGGTTLTIGRLKRNGTPFTLVLSHGKLLRSENFRRVAADNQSIIYMNDVNHAIMIQLDTYKQDIVKEQERAERIAEAGMRVKYIPQRLLESNPLGALKSVQSFIYS